MNVLELECSHVGRPLFGLSRKHKTRCVQKLGFNPKALRLRFLIVNTIAVQMSWLQNKQWLILFQTTWQVRTHVFMWSCIDCTAPEKPALKLTDVIQYLDINNKIMEDRALITEIVPADVLKAHLVTVIRKLFPTLVTRFRPLNKP